MPPDRDRYASDPLDSMSMEYYTVDGPFWETLWPRFMLSLDHAIPYRREGLDKSCGPSLVSLIWKDFLLYVGKCATESMCWGGIHI